MDFFSLLASSQPLLLVTVGIVGLSVGSFLNVVIYRLPIMMERSWREQCAELEGAAPQTAANDTPFNLLVPRSRCPKCSRPIGALENIPLLSYLLQRGRCKGCGEAIGLRYPLVEMFTALLSIAVAWKFGFGWQGLAALVLTWALVALTVIDLDHQLLPDDITLPFLWFGLGLSLFGLFVDAPAAIIGAMAGYLSLWGVYHLFRLLTGKEGMGYGDFKLLALLGAWLGWSALPGVILLSSAVGAVVGITLIVTRGHDRNIPIPFGPYLAAAGWIYLMWGSDLTRFYLNNFVGG